MWALYKLQARAWISNPFAKGEFVTSILFLVVISSVSTLGIVNSTTIPEVFKPELISVANLSVIASITILMSMNGAMYSFGFAFFEMKESVLLKRIGATKISKAEALGSFVLWGVTSIGIMLGWIIIWIAFFNLVHVGDILQVQSHFWKEADWTAVFTSLIVTVLAYLPISLLFVSISKNSEMYNIFVTMYFFLFGFLGGQFTPTIDRTWMEVISYFSPMGWTTPLAVNGLTQPGTIEWVSVPAGQDWRSIGLVQIGLPLLFGFSAAAASTKTFKWD